MVCCVKPGGIPLANPLAQTACIADCTASSLNQPNDTLFWCAGCEGSLYPFIGHVPHHVGGIQASSLLVHRLLAKLHSIGMMWGFEITTFVKRPYFPALKRASIKPSSRTPSRTPLLPAMLSGKAMPFGDLGKATLTVVKISSTYYGVKKQCCLDAVEAAAAASGVGP